MVGYSSDRLATLVLCSAAVGVVALLIYPPRALRKPAEECWLSGHVTSQGCPVRRGLIRLSCCIRPADPPDSGLFPEVTVPIVDGAYEVSHLQGLLPGDYEAWVEVWAVTAQTDDLPRALIRCPRRQKWFLRVENGSRTRHDFRL